MIFWNILITFYDHKEVHFPGVSNSKNTF